jgi:hypothetical protein
VIRSFVHRANRLAKTLQTARKLSHVFSRFASSRAGRYSLLGLADILVGPFRQCGQKRGMGQGSASHLIDPGSTAAAPLTRVPFHGSLTISCGPTFRKSPPFLHDTVWYCTSFLGREVARHPPPPDTAWWGGGAANLKICRPHFRFMPRPPTQHGGGGRGQPENLPAPFPFHATENIVATALRCARFHASAN